MSTSKTSHTSEQREVLPLRSTALTGRELPTRVLLTPWGEVESSNGSFVVDEESARLALEAFSQHGTDLPIDYEHQTLGGEYASPNGQAPAAGWGKQLVAEPGVGLLVQIEWTEPARRQLAARQYRYLSPVAVIRKSDRKLVALHSAALTNKPAIVGMQPIVNRTTTELGSSLDALNSLSTELDLAPEAEPDEILLAARQQLVELKEDVRATHVNERIEQALRSGRLTEAQREWAEDLLRRDEALFDKWLGSAPVVVTCGATRPPGVQDPARGQHALRAKARAQFATYPFLADLTTEEAFVADALRQARPGAST